MKLTKTTVSMIDTGFVEKFGDWGNDFYIPPELCKKLGIKPDKSMRIFITEGNGICLMPYEEGTNYDI